MNCPACGNQMVTKDFGDVKVDVCQGCKGIWFDCGKLTKLDENDEGAGQAIEEALKSERTIDQNRGQLNCPRCGTPMRTHKYKHCKDVNIDECYACGGIFLDSGELKAIKEGFMSNKERDKYISKTVEHYEKDFKKKDVNH